jgi:glycerophosphoryl diester phosphodiesterase
MKTKILLLCLLCTIIQACNQSTVFIGHRVSLLGVENTAEAFVNGVTHFGYQGLECDVKVTVDSQLVCWHDDDLKRVGVDSTITIPTTTLQQLQTLNLQQTRKEITYTAHICTVEEYLAICQQYNVFPVVELKWGIGLNNNDMTLFPALYALIEKYGLVEETVILTSMKHSIEYIRSNYPQLTCQWLRHQVQEEDYAWCQQWDVTLSVAHTSVTEDVVLRSKKMDKDVATWTVNRIEDYQRVKDLDCKYLTTDYLVINQ